MNNSTNLGQFIGLWKFVIFLPRLGQLKVVMEFDEEDDELDTYYCINDEIESELQDIQLNQEDNSLSAIITIISEQFILYFKPEGQNFVGTLKQGDWEVPIRGYRGDQQSASSSLSSDFFEVTKEELENLTIQRVQKSKKAIIETEIKAKVDALIKEMTLQEKIGQLYQMPGMGMITGPEAGLDDPIKLIQEGLVGSILSVTSPYHAYAYQKIAVEQSRLKIPLIFMADVIHGLRTIFPVPIAMSCSWDKEIVKKAAHVAAIESGVAGINLTFSPMVDIARDPRWGRIVEGAGEDALLGSLMGEAYVEGYQGSDLTDEKTILACVKHFAAYGGAEAGRDYNTVDMSEYRLRNYYLPPYRATVKAKVACLMSSFNAILGQPATGNQYLLHDILREEWGFEGMTISDYNSVVEMIAHGVAHDNKEAAKLAMNASLDIEMVSQTYLTSLPDLIEEKLVSIEQIEHAVARVLRAKFQLGLFDDPYRYMNPLRMEELHLCEKHREIARNVARESIVLLKNESYVGLSNNESILPLDSRKLLIFKKISLIGPFVEEHAVIGSWSANGRNEETISLEDGIHNLLSQKYPEESELNISVAKSKGSNITSEIEKGVENALQIAQASDMVILALGEPQGWSGESRSRTSISLPECQLELARAIQKTGKPIVLILFNGRPLDISWFDENMTAIMETWYLGTESGNAIADILFGDYNPSGRLSTTFPRNIGQVPIVYNYYSTGRPKLNPKSSKGFYSRYIDAPNSPLYPFGFGLGYTNFKYHSFACSHTTLTPSEKCIVKIDITNTGKMAGKETVQLYIQDVVATEIRPVKELKDFQKIHIDPGKTEEVIFEISYKTFEFWHSDGKTYAEPGQVKVMIGSHAQDIVQDRTASIILKK